MDAGKKQLRSSLPIPHRFLLVKSGLGLEWREMSESSGAFLTGVNAGGTSSSSGLRAGKKEVLPPRIISDNNKLVDVVNSFRSKVDLMVERQKGEYEEAYEFHMEGVQKELHFLREKAKEIANDKTKEEKINQLDNSQKFYSAESVRLDGETNELRKKLRSLAGTVHVVERERDWLLGKLRLAKVDYMRLGGERTRVMEAYGASLGGSMMSEDSSMTLEIMQGTKGGTAGRGRARQAANKERAGELPPLGDDEGAGGDNAEDPQFAAMSKVQARLEKDLHRSKSALVCSKSKTEGLRRYVEQCGDQVTKGQWDKYFRTDAEEFTPSVSSALPTNAEAGDGEQLDKRAVDDVLDDCAKAVAVQDQDGADVLRRMLAVEICLIPETMDVVLAMLSEDPMKAGGGPEVATSAFGATDAAATADGTLYDLVGPIASSPEKLLAQAEREWDESKAEAPPAEGLNPWGEGSTTSQIGMARDISTYLHASLKYRNRSSDEVDQDQEEEQF